MTRRGLVKAGMAAVAPWVRAAAADQPQRREFVSPHMGTLWRLILFEDDEAPAFAARDAAWALVAAHEQVLSDYRDESELNRLCRTGKLGPLSATLEAVLRRACALAEETDGAFDPTVGPLVRLWRATRKSGVLAAPEVIAEARGRVGWRKIVLQNRSSADSAGKSGQGSFCLLTQPGMQLDFGGIAKGYTQDAVRDLLRQKHGLTRVLIDAGGGVSVGDPPPGQTGWPVRLAAPDDRGAPANATVVSLANQSLATSGDAHQFVEVAGVRYSHIVDPITGLGLTDRIQASVVTDDGATADALATAFCVMGEARTRAFLKSRPAILAQLQTIGKGGQTRVWESKGFDRLTNNR
jgi:thiamine biosynthesis lipoprotein